MSPVVHGDIALTIIQIQAKRRIGLVIAKFHLNSTLYIFNEIGSVQDVVSSDHKPVFSSFEVGLESQALPPKENSAGSGDTVIVFTELEAKVISHGKEAFKLEFHSSCLESEL